MSLRRFIKDFCSWGGGGGGGILSGQSLYELICKKIGNGMNSELRGGGRVHNKIKKTPLYIYGYSCYTDFPEASLLFEGLRKTDPYRLTDLDTYSNVLFVLVRRGPWLSESWCRSDMGTSPPLPPPPPPVHICHINLSTNWLSLPNPTS